MPNWLTNFVLPKIRAVVSRKEVPDNLWTQCPSCEQTLFDEAAFEKIELPKTPIDPLRFRDRKRYTER